MTVFALDEPLAEIVGAVPNSSRVLESFGLDYCCGGGRPFGDACADAGVDPDVVLDALANLEPGPEPDWVSMGPGELVDHLEATHHAYLHAELERLDALAEKVAGVHGSRHPELIDVLSLFRTLRADLEPHLSKEERVLFPMIRELATSSGAPAIGRSTTGWPSWRPIRICTSTRRTTCCSLRSSRSKHDDRTSSARPMRRKGTLFPSERAGTALEELRSSKAHWRPRLGFDGRAADARLL